MERPNCSGSGWTVMPYSTPTSKRRKCEPPRSLAVSAVASRTPGRPEYRAVLPRPGLLRSSRSSSSFYAAWSPGCEAKDAIAYELAKG